MVTIKDEPEVAPPTADTSATSPSSNERSAAASDAAALGTAPAKRAGQPRRHEDWWLADGSVVLELCGVQFRLYRSMLAAKSSFFDNLFKDPAAENVDGCPLYVLDRGTPEDFAAFLTADQGLNKHYYTANEDLDFEEIVPILRVASFYKLRDARAWALDMATQFWPSGLEDEPREGGEAIEVLLLARECHAPELLKGSFFVILCCLLGDRHTHNRLHPADLQRVLTVRGELQRRWVEETSRPPGISCSQNLSTCMNSSSRARDRIVTWTETMHKREQGEESIFQDGLANPFAELYTLSENVDWKLLQYCESCASAMKDRWIDLRATWWDDLDDLLGLKEDADADGDAWS